MFVSEKRPFHWSIGSIGSKNEKKGLRNGAENIKDEFDWKNYRDSLPIDS